MPNVDVVVTTLGGEQSARAIAEGGGLVGIRSSATAPPGVDVEFVDWPFEDEDVTVGEHVDVVRRHRPRYAVAPDVQRGRSLEDTIAVADEIARFAEVVIIVPKTVPADRVPARFRVGLPFRDNFQTDTGANTLLDFRGRPVHVLGGNATDQFGLADEFGLDVRSVDTPSPLSWADFGRVWIGRARGADEAIELLDDRNVDPAALEGLGVQEDAWMIDRSRRARIAFSVRNLVDAWNHPRHVVELPVRVEPGRGPPPPMDEPLHDPWEDRVVSIEEQREEFRRGTMEVEVGRADPDVPETVRTSFERFGETPTSERGEGGAMADGKQEWFRFLQDDADEVAEEIDLPDDDERT